MLLCFRTNSIVVRWSSCSLRGDAAKKFMYTEVGLNIYLRKSIFLNLDQDIATYYIHKQRDLIIKLSTLTH